MAINYEKNKQIIFVTAGRACNRFGYLVDFVKDNIIWEG